MKKIKLLVALFASTALLAGCGGEGGKESFGFGAVATYDNAPGRVDAQTEINYASVVVDAKGVVKKLRIDTVQINVKLNGEGEIILASGAKGTAGDVKSKWELLGDYNMKGASPISKEWYEQAESFENWAVGKTLATIKSSVGTDLAITNGAAVGVTIHVNGFVAAVEQALENKVEVSGKIAQIGVGGINSLSFKRGTEIVAGHDFTVGGAAFTTDKKVVSARIDTFQIPYVISEKTVEDEVVNFVQVDETVAKKQVVAAEKRIKGKQELKELYGMKGASPIEKEWFEQAAALVAFLEGKKVSEALGTEVELANGAAVGVTITIDGYRAALLEAEHTAFNARFVA